MAKLIGHAIDLFIQKKPCEMLKSCPLFGRVSDRHSLSTEMTSITPVLNKLHWLPVEHCSVFQTAPLVYKFLHAGFPQVFCSIYLFLQQFLQYQAQSEWW